MARIAFLVAVIAAVTFARSASAGDTPPALAPTSLGAGDLALIDRVTWGVNTSTAAEFMRLGRDRWLDAQLHPPAKDRLPAEAEAIIAEATGQREPPLVRGRKRLAQASLFDA